MTDKLRPGDRVRGPDGRTGVICEIFSEVLAWVSWENDRPSYESVESLSKVTRFVECQTPSKPARQPRKKVANDHPITASCEYLINGEPTDNQLAVGTKGSLHATISTTGRAAHSAYPEAGESAIEKLLDVLADLRKVNWPGDDIFGETTCNIGVIAGGKRANVIADSAEATILLQIALLMLQHGTASIQQCIIMDGKAARLHGNF